ncbi:hypothetical protein FA10DRAFT_196076 [Acaromyces ingoldii]|uniref:Uncharacterized protein n=1 Tax=Acaromyces ingoldii TaxID=215250 RepID=A0A316YE51_9BASI|nr:hypothetical protein FA10DRAFT_196076 [Acaromyces ingoldii]PWN87144.1 hypothetical protein FA10DRAFT_196076 [Acaromyces ingoldii]
MEYLSGQDGRRFVDLDRKRVKRETSEGGKERALYGLSCWFSICLTLLMWSATLDVSELSVHLLACKEAGRAGCDAMRCPLLAPTSRRVVKGRSGPIFS